MKNLIEQLGNATAFIGILLCLVSGIVRVTGSFHLLGYAAMTIFTAGTAIMVFACLAKLQSLSMQR